MVMLMRGTIGDLSECIYSCIKYHLGYVAQILCHSISYFSYLFLRYEVDDFEEKVLEMYKELEPLYQQLHAYVRRKLYQKYGEVS